MGQVILIITPTFSLLCYLSILSFYAYRGRFLLLFASADRLPQGVLGPLLISTP